MRNEESYSDVFSSSLEIEAWPVLAAIYESVDAGPSRLPSSEKKRERFTSVWRPLVALIAVARRLGSFAYPIRELIKMNPLEISGDEVSDVWHLISSEQPNYEVTKKHNLSFARACCAAAEAQFSVRDSNVLDKRQIRNPLPIDRPVVEVSAEVLDSVRQALPPQPWKPGVHVKLADQLGHHKRLISEAIQRLIEDGHFNRQIDGVVYDRDGRVLAFDPERVGHLSTVSAGNFLDRESD